MANKIIALDAGHGMNTLGKRCMKALDPNQTREWWLNDRIMDKVQAMLANYDCTVIRVDDTTGAKDISLSARVKAANAAKADIYISVHHNAGLSGRDGGGTVVYYYSNKEYRAAQAIDLYNAIVNQTKLIGNRSSKVIKNGFYVLKYTNMPAFLVENGFMDSPTDVPIILSEKHANLTAQGVVNFIAKELSLTTKTWQNEPTASAQTAYYPAYKGAKTTLVSALKSVGVDSSYGFRKQIAAANGITGYIGSASQNTQIYNLLVAGLLKRV